MNIDAIHQIGARLAGFDPFDIKGHPFLRALQPYALPRKASSLACDLFPRAAREKVHSSGLIAWTQLSAFTRATG